MASRDIQTLELLLANSFQYDTPWMDEYMYDSHSKRESILNHNVDIVW